MAPSPGDVPVVVAVDVGGTSMKGAVVAADGTTLRFERRPTERENGPDRVIESVLSFVSELAQASPDAAAVGLVVPGAVDEHSRTAVHSSNIGWRDVPFGELAETRTGLPVAVGHDVRAGGLAEAVHGAGKGVRDFLFLPIGTGIAAAMVLNGDLYPGPTSWAGELGHIPVHPDGEPCPCGRRGCLEAYASCAAIIRRHGVPGLSAEDVIARAQAGDPKARRIWAEALDALAIALDTYTMLLDPALIVLGGGLADSGEAVIRPLSDRLAARLAIREPPPIVAAQLGSHAAMLGAAVLAHQLAGLVYGGHVQVVVEDDQIG